MLLLKNNHLQGGNSNFALCWAASHHSVAEYFPRTACFSVLKHVLTSEPRVTKWKSIPILWCYSAEVMSVSHLVLKHFLKWVEMWCNQQTTQLLSIVTIVDNWHTSNCHTQLEKSTIVIYVINVILVQCMSKLYQSHSCSCHCKE